MNKKNLVLKYENMVRKSYLTVSMYQKTYFSKLYIF